MATNSSLFPIKNLGAVILAAGKGTRMRSSKPKVLQTLLGEPMLAYVIKALEPFPQAGIRIVAGHGADLLAGQFPDAVFSIQKEQLGTGHALGSALSDYGETKPEYLLVANGDCPLLTSRTVENFLNQANGCDMALATILLADAAAYGRVARKNGQVTAIVEAKDFDASVHGNATGEVNAGLYLFKTEVLEKLLPELKNDNKSGEYYITDLVGLAARDKLDLRGIECGYDEDLLGVNSPAELAAMEERLRDRVVGELLRKGVIIHAPALLRASPFTVIEPGAEITAPCEIYGRSVIKSGATVESHCVIRDSIMEKDAVLHSFSHLDKAIMHEGAQAGPYTRLRPHAVLQKTARAGNFVELKNATLGEGAKANHLSYLGDASVGAHANIGAGTITCNYDGKNKFPTSIGEDAFIGSNTALVAPVSVGRDALVGAGSVITKNVPDNEMGIARSRQKNLPRKKI